MIQNSHYFFFWNGPFSNWHASNFWDDGHLYNCVEQYMMAHKAMLFGDYDTYAVIMCLNDPREIKSLGRKVRRFDATVWDFFKYNIVFRGCLQKFNQNGDLRQELLATGDAILVEASPYDRVWGIGFGAADATANFERWGQNLLGKALTEVKTFLGA